MRGAAKATRLRQDVCIELGCLPTASGADLLSGESQSSAEVRAGDICARYFSSAKNGSKKRGAPEIRVVEVGVHENRSFRLGPRQAGFD